MMSIGVIVLGLFIAKSIIEPHGGRIRAENNINRAGVFLLFTLY
jgi:signal transduction histidine kinase